MDIFLDEKGKTIEKPEDIKPKWRISGYALVEEGGKILTVHGMWSDSIELPGGGIDIGESIREGIRRECYEETGYKIEAGDGLIHVGERNFYCTELNEFFKAVILVYSAARISDKQDIEVVNTVEKNEIAKIEWIDPHQLCEAAVHPIVWPVIRKIQGRHGRI